MKITKKTFLALVIALTLVVGTVIPAAATDLNNPIVNVIDPPNE